jgi:hypothetical protein
MRIAWALHVNCQPIAHKVHANYMPITRQLHVSYMPIAHDYCKLQVNGTRIACMGIACKLNANCK